MDPYGCKATGPGAATVYFYQELDYPALGNYRKINMARSRADTEAVYTLDITVEQSSDFWAARGTRCAPPAFF